MILQSNDRVYQTTRRLADRLERSGIAYAIGGAMAVSAHGARRTTDDVGFLLTLESLERFRAEFVGTTYDQVPGRARRFIDREDGVTIDILVTGRHPGRGQPGPIAFPDPDEAGESIEGLKVLTLPQLIQLKLAAGRHYDFGDVVFLIRAHDLDESFQEKLHPSLHRDLDYDRYEVQDFGEYAHHFAPLRQVDRPDRKSRYTQDAGAAPTRVFYYWIFPNLMVNIYPDNLSSNLIVPLGPEKTLAVFEWFFTAEHLAQGGDWIKKNLDYSEGIQQEDVEICETVQRGLKSRHYWAGRLSPKRENGVLQFHRLLHRRLTS